MEGKAKTGRKSKQQKRRKLPYKKILLGMGIIYIAYVILTLYTSFVSWMDFYNSYPEFGDSWLMEWVTGSCSFFLVFSIVLGLQVAGVFRYLKGKKRQARGMSIAAVAISIAFFPKSFFYHGFGGGYIFLIYWKENLPIIMNILINVMFLLYFVFVEKKRPYYAAATLSGIALVCACLVLVDDLSLGIYYILYYALYLILLRCIPFEPRRIRGTGAASKSDFQALDAYKQKLYEERGKNHV